MNHRDRRETYKGFGDGLTLAFELTITPAVFGFAGHLLDGWLGTAPLLMLLLAVMALVGTSVRVYFGYEEEMRRHEAGLPGRGSLGDQLRPRSRPDDPAPPLAVALGARAAGEAPR